MMDFGCVSSRILWIKFKFSRVEVYVVVEQGSTEGIGEEREKFWNDMERTVDGVGNWYRLCMLVLLEFKEIMKVGEEWWNSMLKVAVYR